MGRRVEQRSDRRVDRVVGSAAVACVQSGSDEYPVAVIELGERHRQAAVKGVAGAIIGVIGPGDVAEPARGAVQPAPARREIGKDRRDPALQVLAVIAAPAALRPGDADAGVEQRIALSVPRQQAERIALAQPEGGKHDVLWPAGGDQPPQHKGGERHHLDPASADRGDALQRAARLAGNDVEEFFRGAARDRVFVNDVQRIARLLHVQPGDRPPRAANQIEAAAGGVAHDRGAGEGAVDDLA